MDILPEHLTIIDFIAAAEGLERWLPRQCSVCAGPIDSAWLGDPYFCRRCMDLAPDGVRQRLLRVRDVRTLLGFGKDDDVPLSVRRALHAAADRTPSVVGHPIQDDRLPAGYTYDVYCLHGLSALTPADLNGNPALTATADTPRLAFEAVPAPRLAKTHHAWKMQEMAKLHALIDDDPPAIDPPKSEVIIQIGRAAVPDPEPYARFLWSWRPEAPWSGYDQSEHRTQHLSEPAQKKLRKAGWMLLSRTPPRGAPVGSRISKQRLIDRMQDVARHLKKEPTSLEFRSRFYEDQGDTGTLDVKTLRDAHKEHGWETYREFRGEALAGVAF